MSEATLGLKTQIVIMLAVIVAVAVTGLMTSTIFERQTKEEILCAVSCNSKDIIIRDGKCGCITWKEMK
jgi:hypothetical protein